MIGAVVGTQPFGGTRHVRHRTESRRAELSAPLRDRAGGHGQHRGGGRQCEPAGVRRVTEHFQAQWTSPEQPFSVSITAASRRAENPRQTDSLQKHNLPRRNCGELFSYIQRCSVQVNRLWRRTNMRSNANRAVAAVTAAAIALTTAGVAPAFAASRKAAERRRLPRRISARATAIIGQPRLSQQRRRRGRLRGHRRRHRDLRGRARVPQVARAQLLQRLQRQRLLRPAARLLRRRTALLRQLVSA